MDTKLDAAKELLEMYRANGRIEVSAANASAAELGITPRTLRRAASDLSLARERSGFGGGFEWIFPDAVASDTDDDLALGQIEGDTTEGHWHCEPDGWGNEEWEWQWEPLYECAECLDAVVHQ